MILEKSDFLSNSVHTGWLDSMIANKERAKKPDKVKLRTDVQHGREYACRQF